MSNSEFSTAFSKRLQHVARVKNISQAAVAKAMGKYTSEINRWWHGEVMPRPNTIEVISGILACSYEYLESGLGEIDISPKIKTAKNSGSYNEIKACKDMNDTLAKINRARFKNQCGAVYFDEFFDFIAEKYGENNEGVTAFLEKLHLTDSEYKIWREEKKAVGEDLQTDPQSNLTVNDK